MNPTQTKLKQDLERFRMQKTSGTAQMQAPTSSAPQPQPTTQIKNDLQNFRAQKASGTLPVPEKKDGFFKSIVKAPATIVARPFQAAAALAGVPTEKIDEFSEKQLHGFVAPTPQNASDVVRDVGRGAETVSWGVGAPAATRTLFGAKPILNRVVTAAAEGSLAGGLAGTGQALEEHGADVTAKDVITDTATGAAIGAAGGAALAPIGSAFSKTKKTLFPSRADIEGEIISRFDKGIKPSSSGKNTVKQVERFNDNIVEGTRIINQNKPNLTFTDEAGEVVTNRNPQNIREFTDAINQTKKGIFKQYNDLSTSAGEAGLSVDLNTIGKELDNVINNKSLALTNPRAVEYARQAKQRYGDMGNISADVAEDVIQNLNAQLDAFYKNPSYENVSNVAIDAMIANNLRKSLDEGIEGLTGAQYQAIKKQYGSLKAIEKDVIKALLRDEKKNIKGFIDLTDILSGGQLVHGLVTLNPASFATGLAQKGIASWYKHLNNPNRAVKKMFQAVEKLPALDKPSALFDRSGQKLLEAGPVTTPAPVKPDKSGYDAVGSKKLKDYYGNQAKIATPRLPEPKTSYVPPTPAGKPYTPNQRRGTTPVVETKPNKEAGFAGAKTLLGAGATAGAATAAAPKLKEIYKESRIKGYERPKEPMVKKAEAAESKPDLRKGFVHSENRGARDSGENLYKVRGVTGDLGKYQVKPQTLKDWSKAWLGKTYTPEQFLNDPDAQEEFMNQFLAIVDSYDLSPQDAAIIWHKGWGVLGDGKSKEEKRKALRRHIDSKKGEASGYVKTFMEGLE